MKQRPICHLFGAAVVGLIATHASDAAAFWVEVPGFTCKQDAFSSGRAVGDGQYVLLDDSSPTNTFFDEGVVCPFVDSVFTPDDGFTGATVDVLNVMGTAMAAGQMHVEACTFTNWVTTCGPNSPSPMIPAAAQVGLPIDISNWQHDSAHGYAFVLVSTALNTMAAVAGVHYF